MGKTTLVDNILDARRQKLFKRDPGLSGFARSALKRCFLDINKRIEEPTSEELEILVKTGEFVSLVRESNGLIARIADGEDLSQLHEEILQDPERGVTYADELKKLNQLTRNYRALRMKPSDAGLMFGLGMYGLSSLLFQVFDKWLPKLFDYINSLHTPQAAGEYLIRRAPTFGGPDPLRVLKELDKINPISNPLEFLHNLPYQIITGVGVGSAIAVGIFIYFITKHELKGDITRLRWEFPRLQDYARASYQAYINSLQHPPTAQ